MFLRRTERRKNGKTHQCWNVVENKRLDDGRVVQRHVLYLGEINSSQATAWRKAIEVFDEDAGRSRTLALFPEDLRSRIALARFQRLRLGNRRRSANRRRNDKMVAATCELPASGYALEVDGRLKTEFATRDGARAGAEELKKRFPTLQVRICDAQTKAREEVQLPRT